LLRPILFALLLVASISQGSALDMSLQHAQALVALDRRADMMDICFLLASHGYQADPRVARVVVGGTVYRIESNLTLTEVD
jgi:proteasome assembly chaperone (PAC2) family protein